MYQCANPPCLMVYIDGDDCHIIGLFDLILHGRKEGNVLFNDALNTFYLQFYGVFPISSKGSFICIIPQI